VKLISFYNHPKQMTRNSTPDFEKAELLAMIPQEALLGELERWERLPGIRP
jgi:hypothetical protein